MRECRRAGVSLLKGESRDGRLKVESSQHVVDNRMITS